MKIRFVVLSLLFLLLPVRGFAAGTPASPNLALGASVRASAVANIAWGPEGVVDGDTGPTKGWLAPWKPDAKPWIEILLPDKKSINRLTVAAARFTQVRVNRFARPKRIQLIFFNAGEAIGKMQFDLKDDETALQDCSFGAVEADAVRVTIEEVYTANAQVPDVVGFQEIEIAGPAAYKEVKDVVYGGKIPESAMPAPGDGVSPESRTEPAARKPAPTAPKSAVTDTGATIPKTDGAAAPSPGKLDPEERAILDALQKLLDALRAKFMED